jgi:hypothetical protein
MFSKCLHKCEKIVLFYFILFNSTKGQGTKELGEYSWDRIAWTGQPQKTFGMIHAGQEREDLAACT